MGIMLVFHLSFLRSIDWARLGLLGLSSAELPDLNVPYLFVSLMVSVAACVGIGYIYYICFPLHYKRLEHRQAIARMILDNSWCETEQGQSEGWFKDMGQSKCKKITHFPAIWYRMRRGVIYLTVKIYMDKHQKQLSELEAKVEPGLFCETVRKDYHEGYICYELLYNAELARIKINDVVVKDGKMKLMHHVSWKFDSLPHMLIVGGTGGGKTYFLLTIINALVRTSAVLHILDPKNADLADLAMVMPNVYSTKDEMVACLDQFYDDMMARNASMKQMPNYKTGENYAYLGLPAHFLIFDEYVAFMEMVGHKESGPIMDKIKQIVMLGRQSGFFLILACQRPDAKYLQDGSRDQFNFRVALGKLSEQGYSMIFGDVKKEFVSKTIRGRGYVDVGENVISEFYTPFVPVGYDFLEEIGKHVSLPESNTVLFEDEA